MFTPTDTDVSNIMLELPTLFLESDCCRRPLNWGVKRERSVITEDPPAAPLSLIAPSPPSLPRTIYGNVSPVGLCSEKEEGNPLPFCPGKSDDSCHTRRKMSVRRKTDKLIARVDELSQWRDTLMREIANVRCHFQQLEVFNLALKAKMQEMTRPKLMTITADKPKCNLGTDVKSANTTVYPSLSFVETQSQSQQQKQKQKEVHPQVRFFMSSQKITQISEFQSGPSSYEPGTSSGACNERVGVVNQRNVGQSLRDLDIWTEASLAANISQPFDLTTATKNLRASAAEARQRRIHLYRAKKSRLRNSN